MTVNIMTADKITVDKMTVDNITVKNDCCLNQTNKLKFMLAADMIYN